MRRRFWSGFSAGAAAGVGAAGAVLVGLRVFGRKGNGRVLRLEKSIQIGLPVAEVYSAWSRLEDLPRRTDLVRQVRDEGTRSHWTFNAGGRPIAWEAEITQRIPNRAIGWKSVSGPKHSGRIDFASIGNDTLVHVTMNYVPPGQMAGLFSPLGGKLEHYIEQALRDFKASLEGKGQEAGAGTSMRMPATSANLEMSEGVKRATGTYGQPAGSTQTSRYGGDPAGTVDYTRPPEMK